MNDNEAIKVLTDYLDGNDARTRYYDALNHLIEALGEEGALVSRLRLAICRATDELWELKGVKEPEHD